MALRNNQYTANTMALWTPSRRTILRAGGLIALPAIIGRAMGQVPLTGAGRGAPGGGAFTPASLSGLVAWYSADSGVFVDAGVTLATNGQTAQQWNDRSGNANHLKQATGGNRMTFQSAGFNGKPALICSVAAATWMATTADTVAMGTGLIGSLFGVGAVTTNAGANARICSYIENGQTSDTFSNHSAAWIFTTQISGKIDSFRAGFFASDSAFFPVSTNLRFGNIYDNTNDTNYVNNVAGTPVAATGLTWTSPGTIVVGSQTSNASNAPYDGPISELVMTNSALSSGDRLSLDNYFKAKWGL